MTGAVSVLTTLMCATIVMTRTGTAGRQTQSARFYEISLKKECLFLYETRKGGYLATLEYLH